MSDEPTVLTDEVIEAIRRRCSGDMGFWFSLMPEPEDTRTDEERVSDDKVTSLVEERVRLRLAITDDELAALERLRSARRKDHPDSVPWNAETAGACHWGWNDALDYLRGGGS